MLKIDCFVIMRDASETLEYKNLFLNRSMHSLDFELHSSEKGVRVAHSLEKWPCAQAPRFSPRVPNLIFNDLIY